MANGQSRFRCSQGALGFFRDAADCTVFYRCTGDGQTHRFNCPAGLVFDSRSGTCNWKNQVPECGGGNTVSQVQNNYGIRQPTYTGQTLGNGYQGQHGTGSQRLNNQNNVNRPSSGNQGTKLSNGAGQSRTYQDTLRDILINMPAISFPPDVLKPSFSTLSNTLNTGNTNSAAQNPIGSNSISTNGRDDVITLINPLTNQAEPFLVREIDPNLISPHLVNRFLSPVQTQGNAVFNHAPLTHNIHPFLKHQKPHLLHRNAADTLLLGGSSNQLHLHSLPNTHPQSGLTNINGQLVPFNPPQSIGTLNQQQQQLHPFLVSPQGASQHSVNDILTQLVYPQMLNTQQIYPFAQPPNFPFLPPVPAVPNIPINNHTLYVLSLLANITASSQGALDPVLQFLLGPLLVGNPSLPTTGTTPTVPASNSVTINTYGTVTLNAAALNLNELQCTKVRHVLNTVLSSLVKSLYASKDRCQLNPCVVNIPAIAVTC